MEFYLFIHPGIMKLILPISILILSCNAATSFEKKETPLTNAEKTQKNIAYRKSLQKTDSLKSICRTKNTEQAGVIFSSFIDEHIFPYWIGTPWDYNGVTQVPNEGYIACGYFVTTVLRDAGVHINRVKQAQCASEQMINSLTSIKENYSGLPYNDFIKKVKSKGTGLSIIGLDNHTGFLYFDGSELYFIHSSYAGEGKVAKEIAGKNTILQNSNYKVVGFISKDENFLKKWMKGQ